MIAPGRRHHPRLYLFTVVRSFVFNSLRGQPASVQRDKSFTWARRETRTQAEWGFYPQPYAEFCCAPGKQISLFEPFGSGGDAEVVPHGQTERGSFTVAIACPVRVVESGEGSDSEDPFVRRATRVVMGSARRLVSAIERDDLDALDQVSEGEPVLTSNFCEALLRMQPPEERSSLILSCTWAPGLPLSGPEVIPGEVAFRREHFPLIERVFQKLQPAEEPTPDLFVGYVDSLNGEMGADGRMQGEVTLLLLHEESSLRARVDLSPEQYRTANEAHMAGGVVAVQGILHRGRRVHRLTEVTGFRRVEGGSSLG